MIEVQILNDDLLQCATYIGELPKKTPEVLSNALNNVGDSVLQITVDYIAEGTGLDSADVRPLVEVQEATPSTLRWMMDATAVFFKDSPNWERPWAKPGDNTFAQQQLLQIVTSGDGMVCEVCQQATNKPWTVEDINNMKARWANFQPPHAVIGERTNLVHPNCRCRTIPWLPSRQLNVQFATTPPTPPVVLTVRELSQAIAAGLGAIMKVRT